MARPQLGANTAPVTQAFGDAASAGTSGANEALADHRHGMPANPVTAHEAAADPHTGYLKENDASWTDLTDGGPTILHAHPTTSAPIDPSYLVAASHGGLDNEVVVGATPGGELGGTWAAPTVDALHGGSTHSAVQNAAESTAGGALSTHAAAADPHPGYLTPAEGNAAYAPIAPTVNSSTPTFTGQGTATISSAFSAWIKIGRLVVFRVTFNVTGAGTGGTAVNVVNLGLPGSAYNLRVQGERGTAALIARFVQSASIYQITQLSTEAAPDTALTGAGLTTGIYTFQGSYLADA